MPSMESQNSIRHELELIRGEPIGASSFNPADIPCKETSDAARLCQKPLVTVQMITYNQEAYIRQAIEGVIAQETDFEYELVIGEDCSPDRTREICFEYQKKYPDKIRVLWADVNVNRMGGGNFARCYCHARGEYVAFCEGDDYWTDPHRLQKQVDALRANPSVGLCFARAKLIIEATGEEKIWDRNDHIPHGLIKREDFFTWHTFGRAVNAPGEDIEFLMTATTLIRKSILDELYATEEVFGWSLLLSDSTTWLGLATKSDVYYLPDVVSVYRVNDGGICSRRPMAVCRDAQLVRLYWLKKVGIKPDYPMGFFYGRLLTNRLRAVFEVDPSKRLEEARKIQSLPEFAQTFGTYRRFIWVNSQRWIPVGLIMKTVSVLSLIRRRLFSDMSK